MRVIVLCSDINDEDNYNETDNYDEANYDDDDDDDDEDNLPSPINGKYSDTDNNDEANNDDDIESKKDNSKDEYKENMATKNISLGKALYLVP